MDLDGTLTNPKEGITKSFQYALRAYGIEAPDLDSLCRFIGPPLIDSFMEGYGFSKEKAVEAAVKYRERFEKAGWSENLVYDGIEEALQTLKDAGKTLILATSKPEKFAVRIMEHFKLAPYFSDLCGADGDTGRNRKDEVIRYALEKNHITDLDDVIMVGDRKYDIAGAAACGVKAVGVLYGFGSAEELEEAGAYRIAAAPKEMAELLLSL